jgi:hypothetical protein
MDFNAGRQFCIVVFFGHGWGIYLVLTIVTPASGIVVQPKLFLSKHVQDKTKNKYGFVAIIRLYIFKHGYFLLFVIVSDGDFHSWA